MKIVQSFTPTPGFLPPKLIHLKTGKEVQVGDEVTSFRGDKYVVVGWSEPHSPASQGRIRVKRPGADDHDAHEYYASVFDCKWVNRSDRSDNGDDE